MNKKTGILTIHQFVEAHEGKYICKATNQLEISPGQVQVAVSMSAITTLSVMGEYNNIVLAHVVGRVTY